VITYLLKENLKGKGKRGIICPYKSWNQRRRKSKNEK